VIGVEFDIIVEGENNVGKALFGRKYGLLGVWSFELLRGLV
jgi:hypothetical protein